MAGGVGSRLFPVSTPEHPKQFLDLLGCGKTLIQLTCERFRCVNPDAHFWIVTSQQYVHFVREQLPHVPEECILAEPAARSTAPCIAYACWKIRCKYPDANICVTPADAFVPDNAAFALTARQAMDFASHNSAVVCLGIVPDSPNTGYGYIQSSGEGVCKVQAFKEKPDLQTAQSYLREGGYFWNAGIFFWTAETIEKEINLYAPQIAGVMDRIAPSFYTADETRVLEELFPTCDKISIDYAVMEKSSDVYMIAADWQWSDLGSFESIEKISGKKLK